VEVAVGVGVGVGEHIPSTKVEPSLKMAEESKRKN
jgi:hypothetical protein